MKMPTVTPPDWHRLDAAEVAAHLATTPDTGLADDEAQRRLALHGANELAEGVRRAGDLTAASCTTSSRTVG